MNAKRKPTSPAPLVQVVKPVDVEQLDAPESTIALGQWYWTEHETVDEDGDPITRYDHTLRQSVPVPARELVCVLKFGSNYVEVESLSGQSWRVHLDKIADELTFESNPEAVFASQAITQRATIAATLGEINDRCAALGISPSQQLGEARNETAALARLDGTKTADQHKSALAQAKEDLPELFEKLEHEHKLLAQTMTASTLPLRAQAGDLKDLTKQIDARVLNIDLYAGLSEEIVQLRGGDPADYNTPLAVRQRMLFMDEECVAQYRAGGMSFSRIRDFDTWLMRKDRWRRFLPENRCVVAFRIRRHGREYDGPNDIASFISFWREEDNNRRTYLYIRNGEQVYRLETRFDFGKRLFPDSAARSLDEDMMMSSHGRKIITRREYDQRQAAYEQWCRENPGEDKWHYREDRDFVDTHWYPFTPESVWYDDAMKKLRDQIEHYNRVAMILQGLFDRSACLHPHPPAKLWTPDGFDRAVSLVFDNDHALAPPDRPDFAAYWAECNKTLAAGSVTIGQQKVWEAQARKKYGYDGVPYYLRGPGKIARVHKLHPRTGHVSYRWSHESNVWDRRTGGWTQVGHTTKVEIDKVFNLDGYKPGDFQRFYDDPRTRAEYMQWAKYLLTAEDYHAGKLTVQEPFAD